ncbi:WhiB family transcriptional regulator [Nocardia africana]
MSREKPLELPAPRTDAWDWQLRAACRTHDVNAFHADDESDTAAAKQLCARCPVLARCRDHAITSHEPHGIWGGLTPRERIEYRWAHYRPVPRRRTA